MKKQFILFILIYTTIFAQKDVLTVDVHLFRPMVMSIGSEGYEGYDIDLWERLAHDLNETFNYRFVGDFKSVMPRIKNGDADVSIGGLTIRSDREEIADFTQPYVNTGTGILIKTKIGWVNKVISEFKFYCITLPIKIFPFFLVWLVYVNVIAIIIFFREKGNPDFNDKFPQGYSDSKFFVHVVMSSTGLGNQIPRSKIGRWVTILLMYSGIGFMFPMITGKISSEISERESAYVMCKEDLKGKRIAVKQGTVTAKSPTLHSLGAELTHAVDLQSAKTLLDNDDVDAIVHDKVALDDIAKNNKGYKVVDDLFDYQDYGIALQEGSPLLEKINRLILKYKEDGTMDDLAIKWFGHAR